jgi:hypothetical protein
LVTVIRAEAGDVADHVSLLVLASTIGAEETKERVLAIRSTCRAAHVGNIVRVHDRELAGSFHSLGGYKDTLVRHAEFGKSLAADTDPNEQLAARLNEASRN